MIELLGKMAESLIAGKVDEVTDLTQQALDANLSPKDILEKGLLGETINANREAGIRDQVKIMIGGAPVTSEFAKEIGADAYASNAASAVDKGKELLSL
jgi:methanogenic corrinoid protein MtbC1